MPQLRITQKFASDCKIKQLYDPVITIAPLDDWFIDRMIVDHKKIAVITHAKTRFTFFIPYAEAGGAKEIVAYFSKQLKELFLQNSLPALTTEVDRIFSVEPIFTKTVDKKILGHINDFKRCSKPFSDEPYSIDWRDTAERINNTPIKGGERDWLFPIERFNVLLGINLPERKTRFSSSEW